MSIRCKFADFFLGKVTSLSTVLSLPVNVSVPTIPVRFLSDELRTVFKNIKRKKCHGSDQIPQILLKDTFDLAPESITEIFNKFASERLPDHLQVARVLPLHKKGSKHDVTNYRPISNLSPFSKFYERCLLQRLNQEVPSADGENQHGFKPKHSTETALLTLQSHMSEAVEKRIPGVVYSVDLSAAFDLLVPDKFYNLFKDKLSEGLLFCILDFLQNRKFFGRNG